MAKIIQVIDVNSEGHTFRLSDGSMVSAPHGGEHYSIGDEWGKAPEPQGQPMTVEQAESPAQVEANLISGYLDKRMEEGTRAFTAHIWGLPDPSDQPAQPHSVESAEAPPPQGQPLPIPELDPRIATAIEMAQKQPGVSAEPYSEPQSKRKAKKTEPRDATAEEQEASDTAADKKEAEAE
jgi:hypothetical protein